MTITKGHGSDALKRNHSYHLKHLILAAIVLYALYVYTSPTIGPAPDYYDGADVYSILFPHSLTFVLSSSFGFYAMAAPFVALMGHTLDVPVATSLLAGVLAIVFVYLMGVEEAGWQAGIIAAVFYAFNPLVLAFATRFLADPFIGMMLACAAFLLLRARRTSSAPIYFASGTVAALSAFFGIQAGFTILMYILFVVTIAVMGGRRGKLRGMAYPIAGVVVGTLVYLLVQYAVYTNPFYTLEASSNFFTNASNYIFPDNFYFYTIFPLKYVGTLRDGTLDVYSSLGVLGVLFVACCVLFSTRLWHSLVTYALPVTFFVTYLIFGTDSFSIWEPIIQSSRFLIPVVVLLAVGSSICISEVAKTHPRFAVAVVLGYLFASFLYYEYTLEGYYGFTTGATFTYIMYAVPVVVLFTSAAGLYLYTYFGKQFRTVGFALAAYLIMSLLVYQYMLAGYAARSSTGPSEIYSYRMINYVAGRLASINTSGYAVYDDYTFPSDLCFALGAEECGGGVSNALCSKPDTVIFSGKRLCGGSYFFANLSSMQGESYYVYVYNATGRPVG